MTIIFFSWKNQLENKKKNKQNTTNQTNNRQLAEHYKKCGASGEGEVRPFLKK